MLLHNMYNQASLVLSLSHLQSDYRLIDRDIKEYNENHSHQYAYLLLKLHQFLLFEPVHDLTLLIASNYPTL